MYTLSDASVVARFTALPAPSFAHRAHVRTAN
jgi:hypothetical protein